MLLWILPASFRIRVRVSHALWMVFPVPFRFPHKYLAQSEPRLIDQTVWALPRSLAATYGIIVIFSSSGYLDVSVRRVPPAWLWIHHAVTCSARRVSPFRHPRINAYVQLPAAFRSLSRLSSAPSARASTLRPTMLNLSAPCSPPGPIQLYIFPVMMGTSGPDGSLMHRRRICGTCLLFFSLACYCFLDLHSCHQYSEAPASGSG